MKKTEVYRMGFLQGLKQAERIILETLERDTKFVAKLRHVESILQDKDNYDIKGTEFYEDKENFAPLKFTFSNQENFIHKISEVLDYSYVLRDPDEYLDIFWNNEEQAVIVRYTSRVEKLNIAFFLQSL